MQVFVSGDSSSSKTDSIYQIIYSNTEIKILFSYERSCETLVGTPFSHGFARLFPTHATQEPHTFLNPGVHAGFTEAGGRLRKAKLIT